MAEEKAVLSAEDKGQDWPKEPQQQKARLKRISQSRAAQLQVCPCGCAWNRDPGRLCACRAVFKRQSRLTGPQDHCHTQTPAAAAECLGACRIRRTARSGTRRCRRRQPRSRRWRLP